MSTTSEITSGAVRGLTPLIVLGGVVAALYLYRDRIKDYFMPGTEAINDTIETIEDVAQTPLITLPKTGETIAVGEVSNMGSGITGLVKTTWDIFGQFYREVTTPGEESKTEQEVLPITGNPIEYQPSKVSEYVATNAYLPGVTLLPENQNTLWRPTNQVVGQIQDISEFTGGVDIYDIIRDASSTGNGSLYAVRHGAGLSEGGIDVSSWDRVFKKDTYKVVMF